MKYIFLLLAFISFEVMGQLKDTIPFSFSGSNRIFKNLHIQNSNGHGINLNGASNITIENCTIENTSGNGVNILNTNGVTVRNCYLKENQSGVYAQTSQNIVVENCNGYNFNGPMPRGQFVQYNGCTGGRVSCNYIENVIGQSNSADVINMFATSGTASNPILIENNYIKGGGPMESACGILVGDDGGQYITVRGNVLVNVVASGIGVPTGQNILVENNKLYGKQQSFTNVGIAYWKYDPQTCANNTFRNNQVQWTNKNGVSNPFYNPGVTQCSGSVWTNNTTSGVSETMPAPTCAGVQGSPSAPDVQPYIPNGPDVTMAQNDSVIVTRTWTGTVNRSSWTKISGPATATIDSISLAVAKFKNFTATGVTTYRLQVWNASNQTDIEDVVFTITAATTPPPPAAKYVLTVRSEMVFLDGALRLQVVINYNDGSVETIVKK